MRNVKDEIDKAIYEFESLEKGIKISQQQQSIAGDTLDELRSIAKKYDELSKIINKRAYSKDGEKGLWFFSVLALAAIGLIPSCVVAQVSMYGHFSDWPAGSMGNFVKAYGVFALVIAIIAVFVSQTSADEKETVKHREEIENQIARLSNDVADARGHYVQWVRAQAAVFVEITSANTMSDAAVTDGINFVRSGRDFLNQAESEFSSGAFVAFWDNVEKAAGNLEASSKCIRNVRSNCLIYDAKLLDYSGTSELPVFSVSGRTIDELGSATLEQVERLKSISYDAQKNFQFATIYEQRRNTSTLVRGFTSLGQALNNVGSRIESAIFSLEDTVSEGLKNVVVSIDRVQTAVENLEYAIDRNATTVAKSVGLIRNTLDESFDQISKHHRFSRAKMTQTLKNDHEKLVLLGEIRRGVNSKVRQSSSLYSAILDAGPKIPTP